MRLFCKKLVVNQSMVFCVTCAQVEKSSLLALFCLPNGRFGIKYILVTAPILNMLPSDFFYWISVLIGFKF